MEFRMPKPATFWGNLLEHEPLRAMLYALLSQPWACLKGPE